VTTGVCNIAIGSNAYGTAAAGGLNIAIGSLAMGASLVTGIDNIAIGTTSMDALLGGICNIGIGINSLGAATTGCFNIAIGGTAMGTGATTGVHNISIGCGSGKAMTSGNNNVAIGHAAGEAHTTGCRNISIGYTAGASVSTTKCVINIGNGADITTAGVACIVANCLLTACFFETSDCRSKCKIKDLPYGLNFINLLRPVSYKWKPQADKLDKNGNLIEAGEKNHTGPRSSFGLLGQEVKGALDKLGLGYDDFGAYSDQEYENRNNPDWKKSYTMEDKTIALSYIGFISPLIKSVQELSTELSNVTLELTELKSKLKTT